MDKFLGDYAKRTIRFYARFAHYTPINFDPHYLFQTDKEKYLIKCSDYPELIGKLSPYDLVNIEAELLERSEEDIKLTNVKWEHEMKRAVNQHKSGAESTYYCSVSLFPKDRCCIHSLPT